MIDVKELRIDNWVEDEDNSHERFRIEEIIPGDEYTEGMWFVNGRWTDDLLPIPLTSEVLTNCGLEPIPTAEDDGDPDYASTGWRAYYSASYMECGKDYFCIWDNRPNGYMMDGFSSAPLQYLHQLQNLFYCLTGQELKCEL